MKRPAFLPLLAVCALVPALAAHAENFGNETLSVGNDVVVKFTSGGTFVLDKPATARVFVVGGGGAGGTGIGGGGRGGSGVVIVRWYDPAGLLLLVK